MMGFRARQACDPLIFSGCSIYLVLTLSDPLSPQSPHSTPSSLASDTTRSSHQDPRWTSRLFSIFLVPKPQQPAIPLEGKFFPLGVQSSDPKDVRHTLHAVPWAALGIWEDRPGRNVTDRMWYSEIANSVIAILFRNIGNELVQIFSKFQHTIGFWSLFDEERSIPLNYM